MGDLHVPYHDRVALGAVRQFVRELEPTHVYLSGDLLDFYALSSFNRDPRRITGLQEEIDEIRVVLDGLQKDASGAEFAWLDGNHEYRLTRYMRARAPELSSLRALDLQDLLKLEDRGIQYYHYGSDVYHGSLRIEHGDCAPQYAAAKMVRTRLCSGVSGHTHRQGVAYLTGARHTLSWHETGCLCELRPSWMRRPSNWQQGLAVVVWHGKNYQTSLATIRDGVLWWGGERWRA
jgi:UDP-2,3-diacylglucosamine pyrophosphatase LpxH